MNYNMCIILKSTLKQGNVDQFWRFLTFNNLTLSIKKLFPIDHNTLPLSYRKRYFDNIITVLWLNTFKQTAEQSYPILCTNC